MNGDYEPTPELRWAAAGSTYIPNGMVITTPVLEQKWAKPVYVTHTEMPGGFGSATIKAYSKTEYEWRRVI